MSGKQNGSDAAGKQTTGKISLKRINAVVDFYQNVDAYGQGVQREDRRYRKDVFAKGVMDKINVLCNKYYQGITGLSPERLDYEYKRLYEFLRSLIIVNGNVKSTRYKPGGIRQRKALSIETIEQEFRERGISFVELPAKLLLVDIMDIYENDLDAKLWQELEVALRGRIIDHETAKGIQGDKGYRYYEGHLIHIKNAAQECCSGAEYVQRYYGFGEKGDGIALFKAVADRWAHQESIIPSPDIELLERVQKEECCAALVSGEKTYGLRVNEGDLKFKRVGSAPRHSLKAIRNKEWKCSDKVKSMLHALSGGKKEVLDQLSVLFADIVDPRRRKGRLTVVYTHCNVGVVQQLLQEVFQVEKIESVNKVLTRQGCLRLLEGQVCGKELLLIEERIPTDTYHNKFFDLIRGDKMSVLPGCIEKQTFYNRMHVVCVTSDPKVLQEYRNVYKAEVVDLTESEFPIESSGTHLNAEEQAWFHTVFALHGCRVKNDRTMRKQERVQDIAGLNILQFLADCCKLKPDGVSEVKEVYAAYCEHYRAKHGVLPPEKSIGFKKALLSRVGKRVTAKTTRYGAEKKPQLCYHGLALKKDPKITEAENELPEWLYSYLDEMERFAKRLLTAKGGPGMPLKTRTSGLD